MYKKLLSSLLVIALLNLVGCYSEKEVTINNVLTNNGISDITVNTKDSLNLLFEKPEFFFDNDTLIGKASVISTHTQSTKKYDWKIPLSEIVKIEIDEFDGTKTLIFGGVALLVLFGILFFLTAASGGIMSDWEMKF